jgi:hypothetical protein
VKMGVKDDYKYIKGQTDAASCYCPISTNTDVTFTIGISATTITFADDTCSGLSVDDDSETLCGTSLTLKDDIGASAVYTMIGAAGVFAPTSEPTFGPTDSPAPSLSPTSAAPTMTAAPTSRPTVSPTRVHGAISCGESTTSYTTAANLINYYDFSSPNYDGTLSVSTCSNSTDYDTYLLLFAQNDCGGTALAWDDDVGSSCTEGSGYYSSEVSYTMTADTQYCIGVKGYSTLYGNYGLSVACTDAVPTNSPTFEPTSAMPSLKPSNRPTRVPSLEPTLVPTELPSVSLRPTSSPKPTSVPTLQPTKSPTLIPTERPTSMPSLRPTKVPSLSPTLVPSPIPTVTPLPTTSPLPTGKPTAVPTRIPTLVPTPIPSLKPSGSPTRMPSMVPSSHPSITSAPTNIPSISPTTTPTTATPSSPPSPLPSLAAYPDCDFGSGTCSFSSTGSYSWSRGISTPSSDTGPQDGGVSGSSDYFMYVESSSPNHPNVGPFVLESGRFEKGADYLSFWYNLYGETMGTLQVHVYDSSTVAYASTGINDQSCVELISNASTCETVAGEMGYTYEGTTETAVFPSGCFLEFSSGASTGDVYFNTAGSSTCGINGQACLCKSSWSTAWSLSGNQGSEWFQSTTSLSPNVTQIRFVGVTGTSYTR